MSPGWPLLICLSYFLVATGGLGTSGPVPQPDRIRLARRDLIPEGIAWDAADSVFYLSSIHRRSVFRLDRAGNGRELGPTGDAGAFGMLGLKVDTARRRLWACSTAFDAGADQGRTAG
jgi:sugar lactone lactonase YvrE